MLFKVPIAQILETECSIGLISQNYSSFKLYRHLMCFIAIANKAYCVWMVEHHMIIELILELPIVKSQSIM